jgi:F0F1-type ATP synthase assembly protein I
MQNNNEKTKGAWWQPGMQLFLKLSGWIGGPAVAGVLIGKYLDQKYNTDPWLLIFCSVPAFAISMIMLVIISNKEMKKINKENEK